MPSRLPILYFFLVGAAAPAMTQSDAQPAPAPAAPLTVPMAPPAPLVPHWTRRDAEDLLSYIQEIGREGLDPAYYDPQRLRDALSSRDGATLDAAATDSFMRLSSDLSLGHVRGEDRVSWYVQDPDLRPEDQNGLLTRALQTHTMPQTLDALLPSHPQYSELKAALARTPAADKATLAKIRVNLDRWRWLPRDLGQKYVIVNVAAYSVALVENGQVTARRRAVAGAIKTPTPQLSATITGAIFNPWWEVPESIAKEVRGKRGYVTASDGNGGVRWRQPPGPSNALGRVKLVMPNRYNIYLHDTNAKGLFDKQMRAYSHGCIRTEDALGFAATLLETTGKWDQGRIEETVASGKTVQANLAAPVPVYIAYFTAAATTDGGVAKYQDIYNRDARVAAALGAGTAGD